MKAYFKLQFSLFNRKIKEIGLSPLLGYGLTFLIFYGISFTLFSLTEFAEYIYCLIAIALISKLSESGRNDFLKTVFSTNDYRKLRIVENLLLALPFVLFLLFENSFLLVLILIPLSTFLSIFNFSNSFNYTIPTPFGRKPFEFLVGFRKTFLMFPLAYFITYQSILVGNFNLGIFSMLLITIVVLTYYSKPENEIYVWNFSLSSKGFLMNKIRTGILFLTLLISPIIISLIVFFPEEITISLVFLMLSYLYLIAMILAKYSVFPNEMNLPEGILLFASVFFPPLLLIVIPIFYSKSITQLNFILDNDSH
jgi:hypothetical protein